MTVILATLLSIAVITALAWVAKRLLHAPLCPICSGIAGTWLWMVVARHFGVAFDTSMLSVLLGGSAVGIACQLEKHLPDRGRALLWKSLFIPVSLIAAYGIALPDWTVLAVAVIVLLGLTAIFFRSPRLQVHDSATVEKLQEQMKKCC